MTFELELHFPHTRRETGYTGRPVPGARTRQHLPPVKPEDEVASNFTAAADATVCDVPVTRTGEQSAGAARAWPNGNDWGRMLHWNFFIADAPTRKELPVTTLRPRQVAAFHALKSTFRVAATLLGVYVAMYLTVAGVAHALLSPDVAFAAATILPASAATTSTSAVGIGDLLALDSFAQASDWIDNSRECMLYAGIDSMCIFN